MRECSGIYRVDLFDECIYVGQSINVKSRKSSHIRKLKNNKHDNIYMQRLYNKYKENFIFSLIEECNPKDLTTREIFWINTLKPKCNIQIPLDSTHFTITEESRKKMSEISKRRMTMDMRKYISDKTKEAMHQDDVWENFIRGQKNKPYKAPWNKGLKGVQVSSRRKRVFCKEINKIFDSAFEAGVYVGAKNGKGISRVCLGQRNKYKNMHWQYI